MKQIRFFLLMACICQILQGCYFLFPGDTTLEQDGLSFDYSKGKPGRVVVIQNNALISRVLADSFPLGYPNTDDGKVKTSLSLSYDLNKVVYLEANGGIPVIVNLEDGNLERLTQYFGVSSVGWLNNDEAIFMQTDSEIKFHGGQPSKEIPKITKIFSSEKVLEVSISKNYDVLCKFGLRRTFGYYPHRVELRFADSDKETVYYPRDTYFIDNSVDDTEYEDVWLSPSGKEAYLREDNFRGNLYWNIEKDFTDRDRFESSDDEESIARKLEDRNMIMYARKNGKLFFRNNEDIFFSTIVKTNTSGSITEMDYKAK